jgi:hypothetical protein
MKSFLNCRSACFQLPGLRTLRAGGNYGPNLSRIEALDICIPFTSLEANGYATAGGSGYVFNVQRKDIYDRQNLPRVGARFVVGRFSSTGSPIDIQPGHTIQLFFSE